MVRAMAWLAPALLGAGLMAPGMAARWVGSFDANGALYSTAARNYLRYGLAATRGGQVCNAGALGPGDFRFYSHHPPGISLALAASFAALGESEWAARLVPLLFTLGAAVCLQRVGRALGGQLAGGLAAIAFVLQPMIVLYGRMPDHEAPAAFFALLLATLYVNWQGDGRRRWLAAMAVAAFLGVWFAWVVAVVPWLLLAHGLVVKRRGAAGLLAPVAAGVAGFATVLGHIALVEGGLGGLWAALAHRVGTQAGDRLGDGHFGAGEFLARQGLYLWRGFSFIALAAALLWLVGPGRRKGSNGLLVGALGAFALFNVLAFRQGAYVHIYYQFYLAAPLALACGQALAWAWRRAGRFAGPLLALGLLAGVAAEAWHKVVPARLGAAFDAFYPAHLWLAEHLACHTEPSDKVLLRCDWRSSFRQVAYYADRNILVVPEMDAAKKLWAEGRFNKAFNVHWISGWSIAPLFAGHPSPSR